MANIRKLKGEKKTRKARGGLAADMAADATTASPAEPNSRAKKDKPATDDGKPRSKGKLGQLMGFSVVSVMQRLGAEGISIKHAMAIMEAQGIKAAVATVAQNVRLGKNGKGKSIAPLTKEQFVGLRDSASEPVEAAS